MQLKYRRRRPEEREKFTVPVNQRKGPPPGPEVLPWYWHPDREGAVPPPAAFAEQLARIDPDLRVCYSPVHERWILWVKNPRIGRMGAAQWLCRGWQLLMLWEHSVTHEFLPLSELVFANVYLISAGRYAGAKEYYDKLMAEAERAKEERSKKFDNDRQAEQNEVRESWKISSAGDGSRSALHHSGTVVPSQGEAAWRAETRKHRLPPELLKREEEDREKAFYGR